MKKYSFFEHKMNNRNQRLANKKSSNLKLISSTIKNLSKKGINELTMHDVSSGAGLSQGIVNFHFKSKEILLIETLKFISNEYLKSFDKYIKKSGNDPIMKLINMINNDINHFIEIGPGKVLSGLVKRISREVKIDTINNLGDIEKLKI